MFRMTVIHPRCLIIIAKVMNNGFAGEDRIKVQISRSVRDNLVFLFAYPVSTTQHNLISVFFLSDIDLASYL